MDNRYSREEPLRSIWRFWSRTRARRSACDDGDALFVANDQDRRAEDRPEKVFREDRRGRSVGNRAPPVEQDDAIGVLRRECEVVQRSDQDQISFASKIVDELE